MKTDEILANNWPRPWTRIGLIVRDAEGDEVCVLNVSIEEVVAEHITVAVNAYEKQRECIRYLARVANEAYIKLPMTKHNESLNKELQEAVARAKELL